jgi:aminopeptidase N
MNKGLSLIGMAVVLTACITSPPPSSKNKELDASRQRSTSTPKTYCASATRSCDIIHTKLELSFNWDKQHVFGKAYITLKPYFYPIKEVLLDAQGFDIHALSLLSNTPQPLHYRYDKKQLVIELDKDTLTLFIDYTAKPNERIADSTGVAITSDKGLYFINPRGEDKNKPTQLWSQGEVEANSAWFPTVDKPNERMTQEVFITLDSAHKKMVTLSNGLLLSSKENKDKSRTDYWKQSLPAAPYLTMIAAGDFAVIKDKWKNREVNYYVEPDYAPYAKMIFGNTPEMIEFFSNKMGVNYPWEKYSQMVVRDYVSGAMENTTAVIHGEFLQQTDRELLDKNNEDVISHELFHHWFGDYVTCKSWANLTLNEGFATYGEYLWREYKYGRDAADELAYEAMDGYLESAEKNPKHLIRYQYEKPDDLFDTHSYNKGGAILHMLRNYVGDEAFFSALKVYLEQHSFASVEAADLRLAFEQITGEDLKWFFDQWFFDQGHPLLQITHAYNDSFKTYTVKIEQLQNLNQFPLFKLPIDMDIYRNQTHERKRVWLTQATQEFSFAMNTRPNLMNVDAEKNILCIKDEPLTIQERVFQYKNCPLYADRLEALQACANHANDADAAQVILSALKDKNQDLRRQAISYLEKLPQEYASKQKELLVEVATNDEKAKVRAMAMEALGSKFKNDESLVALYEKGVNDPSYSVVGASLIALAAKDSARALTIAQTLEKEKSTKMALYITSLYSQYGTDAQNPFFTSLYQKTSGWETISFARDYANFLKRCSDDTLNKGVKILETLALLKTDRWASYYGQKGIKELADMYADREEKLTQKIKALKNNDPNLKIIEEQKTQAHKQNQKLVTLYQAVTVL